MFSKIQYFVSKRLIVIGIALLVTPVMATAASLQGAWLGTGIITIGGDNPGFQEVTNTRLLMYTDSHFMWSFELGDREEGNTDAAIAEATRLYQSSGGTYMLNGTTIIYTQRININPALMRGENQTLVREIRTLTPTMLETQVTNDDGVTAILRYRRVE